MVERLSTCSLWRSRLRSFRQGEGVSGLCFGLREQGVLRLGVSWVWANGLDGGSGARFKERVLNLRDFGIPTLITNSLGLSA
jgi:hypothetical protein